MEHFATTRWSLIVDAQSERTPQGQRALATLCELYWYPLYAYLRRRGHTAEDAQDLTQGFFSYLLEHSTLGVADRARGRFRSFLLAALNHYVSNVRDWERAQKRGGASPRLSIDTATAEGRFVREPADLRTPDKVFDRQWALTVLDEVLMHVQMDCQSHGSGELFERLKWCLTGDRADATYRELGVALGMTEGAVKQAVHRLRRQYRRTLYAEIAKTVSAADDVEGELHHLIAALAS
jgi:RNA polymerase sigma-70 factor (ECF subfamily)